MIEENTRRELLKRLKVIAAVSGGIYIAPKVVIIKNVWAGHQPGHCSGQGGCSCG